MAPLNVRTTLPKTFCMCITPWWAEAQDNPKEGRTQPKKRRSTPEQPGCEADGPHPGTRKERAKENPEE